MRESTEVGSKEQNMFAKKMATTELYLNTVFSDNKYPGARFTAMSSEIAKFFRIAKECGWVSATTANDTYNALMDTAKINDQIIFVKKCIKILEPFIHIRVAHNKEFEDREASKIMELQNYTPLNSRVSYGIHDNGARIQLHLAPSKEVKEQVEDMYRDALHKIVPVVLAHPEIKTIGGASWLNATKTYGAMKERLGFILSDTPIDIYETHFKAEQRHVKDALMTRKRFLELYGKSGNEE